MHDHYYCLDCGQGVQTAHHWIRGSDPLVCPACGSYGLRRSHTLWRTLRDALLLTTAA